MSVFGIRREADAVEEWSEYVVGAVNLLNEHLNPRGKYFYFDEIDAYASDIGGHKVYDMYGWVIDEADVAEFEPLWLAEADRHSAPDGSTSLDRFRDVTVIWEDRGGTPHARITFFDSFDEEPEVIPYD